MKIPTQKEFAIKKAIMLAIEKGESVAKLSPYFGVSKSTIYKYRRVLREQGFIIKNENDIYVITENKFSKKPKRPKTADLNFGYNTTEESTITKQTNYSTDKELNNNAISSEIEYTSIKEIPTDEKMEQRLQDKIQQMRSVYEQNTKKSILKKIFSKFKS